MKNVLLLVLLSIFFGSCGERCEICETIRSNDGSIEVPASEVCGDEIEFVEGTIEVVNADGVYQFDLITTCN